MVNEKNWLIRTSNFQILGPVSKPKIIEFVEKGSLKGEDEISSGNGYWFLIKEKDLLEKYVYGDIPQTFNPISEAPNVLTANLSENTGTHNKIQHSLPVSKNDDSDVLIPADDDLEYPDMNLPAGDDLEYPDLGAPSGALDLSELSTAPSGAAPKPSESADSLEDLSEGLLPPEDDLEYPDMGDFGAGDEDIKLDEFEEETDPSIVVSDFDEETDPGITPLKAPVTAQRKAAPAGVAPSGVAPSGVAPSPALSTLKASSAQKKKVVRNQKAQKPQRNDKLLFVLTGVFFVALLFTAVIFYYKKVLNKPLPIIGSEVIEWVLPQAHAQTGPIESLVKKKLFLIFKIS